jgi:hypothetical protein
MNRLGDADDGHFFCLSLLTPPTLSFLEKLHLHGIPSEPCCEQSAASTDEASGETLVRCHDAADQFRPLRRPNIRRTSFGILDICIAVYKGEREQH